MRLPRRIRSRSAITAGSPASMGRNRCGSVRNPPAATRASRRSSLAPAKLTRSRSRSSCLGLIACTAKPRSRRASTTGPCGTSIATATRPGSPAADTSQSHRAAKPAPPCRNARSPTILPAASRRQTWCFSEPQSTPTNQLTVPSAMILALRDDTSRHDVCRSLYWRSKARLPTGPASRPTRRGTCPIMVLTARVDAGCSRRAGPSGQLTARRDQTPPEGTGVDVCYTNHAQADQDDMDNLLTLLGIAGCTYAMGVPGADDVMLSYQSTSFHDALYVRSVLRLRPAPEFEAWLKRMGIADETGRVRPSLAQGGAA